ncbi:MAG TPA: hypothetical protein VGJ18_12255 [Gemmatimonadaceae bacterium]
MQQLAVDRAKLGADCANIVVDRANLAADSAELGVDRTKVGIDRTKLAVDRTLLAVDWTKLAVDCLRAPVDCTSIGVDGAKVGVDRTKLGAGSTIIGVDSAKIVAGRTHADAHRANPAADRPSQPSLLTPGVDFASTLLSLTENRALRARGNFCRLDVRVVNATTGDYLPFEHCRVVPLVLSGGVEEGHDQERQTDQQVKDSDHTRRLGMRLR